MNPILSFISVNQNVETKIIINFHVKINILNYLMYFQKFLIKKYTFYRVIEN